MIEPDPLARGRARVERRVEGLRIEIPAKREWWLVAMHVVIAAVWVGIFVATVVEVASGEKDLGSQLPPLIILPLGLLFLIWALAQSLAGREVATVTIGELVLERIAWPIHSEKRFRRDRIERLRTDAPDRWERTFPRLWSGQWERYGLAGGSIVFDYGARTHRFGIKLDYAESRQLAELLANELGLELPTAQPERPVPF